LGVRGKFFAYKSGREASALSDLNEAIALGTPDYRVYYAKGIAHMMLHQFQDALAAFDGALKVNPRTASTLSMRAKVHRELGQTELAVADMTRAILANGYVLQETLPALQAAGYWRSKDMPEAMTPALEDAIRACMIDKNCN
jgi:tetratricopeptide (TPR) repeat protein